MKYRSVLFVAVICVLSLVISCTTSLAAGRSGSSDSGTSFIMKIENPGRDPVEFKGAAFGDDFSLSGVVGGIETVTLNTGGKLYTLTPAVKTARPIENPEPPSLTSGGWTGWLVEPGRINPLTFAERIGLEESFSGNKPMGEGDRVNMRFSDGRLESIRFPNNRGDGSITYTYSDFRSDSGITQADMRIPPEYRVLD